MRSATHAVFGDPASGELRLPVASVHALEGIGAAPRTCEAPGRVSPGKILLRPDSND